jgi:hypothetical protein
MIATIGQLLDSDHYGQRVKGEYLTQTYRQLTKLMARLNKTYC